MVSSRFVLLTTGVIIGSSMVLAAPTPSDVEAREPSLFSLLKPAAKVLPKVFSAGKKVHDVKKQRQQEARELDELLEARDSIDLEELIAREPSLFSLLKPAAKVLPKVFSAGKKVHDVKKQRQQEARELDELLEARDFIDLEELIAREPSLFSLLKPAAKILPKVFSAGKKVHDVKKQRQQEARELDELLEARDFIDLEELIAREPSLFSLLKPAAKILPKVFSAGKKVHDVKKQRQQEARELEELDSRDVMEWELEQLD